MQKLDKFLVEGEKILYEVEREDTILGATDRRLVEISKKKFRDIAYSHIISMEWGLNDKPLLLLMGSVFGVFGGFALIKKTSFLGKSLWMPPLTLGILLIIFYFATRHMEMIIITEKKDFTFEFSGIKGTEHFIEFDRIIRKIPQIKLSEKLLQSKKSGDIKKFDVENE